MKLKQKIASVLISLSILGAYFFPLVQFKKESTGLALPEVVAVFETSLASPISSSATSLTLTANSLRGGSTYSGYTCLTIDEGTAQREDVCGTLSGTSMTGVTRGINPRNGTSTVAALQFAHRRGANVKVTDFPIVINLRNQANGLETFPNLLSYADTVSIGVGSPTTTLTTKAYVDGVAVAGASNGDESTKGIFEASTALEQASSTILGSTGAGLAMQARYATDTPLSGCASGFTSTAGAGCSVVATLAGKIRQTWFNLAEAWTFSGGLMSTASSTFTSNTQFSATTTVSGNLIGKQFGGDGTDGALSITSGTTTLDISGASIFVKNYTSISITGTGHLAFSGAPNIGSTIVLKSQGNVTLTCSPAPCISTTGAGAKGGAGGAAGSNSGTAGTSAGTIQDDTTTHYGGGAVNGTYGTEGSAGAVYGNLFSYTSTSSNLFRGVHITSGSGGGGGAGANDGSGSITAAGGDGGRGGGALILQIGGYLNFTTTRGIDVSGQSGTAGGSVSSSAYNLVGAGGGGGGSAGMFVGLYNLLTANTGTVWASGGEGGRGGDCTDTAGGAGGNSPTGSASGGGAGHRNVGVAGVKLAGLTAAVAGNNAGAGAGGSGGSGAGCAYNDTTTRSGGVGGTSSNSTESSIMIKNDFF